MTDSEYLKYVGAKIEAVRKKKKVTLKMIQDAGITRAANMCLIQQGKRSARLLTLKRLADLLKVDIKSYCNE